MTLSFDVHVVVRDEVLSAEAGGDVVVMDPQTGSYFTFEGVGSDIWRRIGAPIAVSTLCDGLLQDYDAPADEIRTATLAFLGEMLEKRLIVAA